MDRTSWRQGWKFPNKLCGTGYRRFVVDHVKLIPNNCYMVKSFLVVWLVNILSKTSTLETEVYTEEIFSCSSILLHQARLSLQKSYQKVDQRFLSGMAFSMCRVARVDVIRLVGLFTFPRETSAATRLLFPLSLC